MRLMHTTIEFRPPEKFVTCMTGFSVCGLKPDIPESTTKATCASSHGASEATNRHQETIDTIAEPQSGLLRKKPFPIRSESAPSCGMKPQTLLCFGQCGAIAPEQPSAGIILPEGNDKFDKFQMKRLSSGRNLGVVSAPSSLSVLRALRTRKFFAGFANRTLWPRKNFLKCGAPWLSFCQMRCSV